MAQVPHSPPQSPPDGLESIPATLAEKIAQAHEAAHAARHATKVVRLPEQDQMAFQAFLDERMAKAFLSLQKELDAICVRKDVYSN